MASFREHRVLCDFVMDCKLEHRTNFKFCVNLRKCPTYTFNMIRHVYGNAAMSRARCFEWHACFKSGRTSLDDDKSSGRPSASSASENMETVRLPVHEDR